MTPDCEIGPEPKFLNSLKCNLAESASAGFQFNSYGIFNNKALYYRTTFEVCKNLSKDSFLSFNKNCSLCTSPVVLSDL